jgi:hypothetical protein
MLAIARTVNVLPTELLVLMVLMISMFVRSGAAGFPEHDTCELVTMHNLLHTSPIGIGVNVLLQPVLAGLGSV